MTVEERKPEVRRPTPEQREKIVVLGGYGAVGQVVARTLARQYPGQVVAAGRTLRRAEALADATNGAIRPAQIDVDHDAEVQQAIEGASVVIMSVERANERVARACLERGVHYVDVSASESVLAAIRNLGGPAVRQRATAVLSVGLAPGLTNLLAHRAARLLPGARQLDITLMAGLGERHGADAVRWTVEQLGSPKTLGEKSAGAMQVRLPGFGQRTAYPFSFSERFGLRESLGVNAVTRLCFGSALLTDTIFALRSAGLFTLARRAALTGQIAAGFARVHVGDDRFVVQAVASTPEGNRVTCTATGRNAGRATGIVAARVVQALLDGAPKSGVLHIDQAVDVVPFLADLANDGFRFSWMSAMAGLPPVVLAGHDVRGH